MTSTPADHDPFVRLDITELRAMAALDPTRLLRWLEDTGSAFLFGVERFEPDEDRWGGLYRLTLNRNIEVHLIPDFNTAMLDASELPPFVVMPHALKLDVIEERPLAGHDDADADEPATGVTFYVSPEEFEEFLEEAEELVDDWRADPFEARSTQSFPFLPESFFRSLDLVQLINLRILPHALVEAQRRYDGRLGYPLTPQEQDDIDEDLPPPLITTEVDEQEAALTEDWTLDDEDIAELRAREDAWRSPKAEDDEDD